MEFYHPHYGQLYRVPLTPPDTPDPYLVLPHACIEEVLQDYALAAGKARLVRPAKVIDLVRESSTGRVCGVRYQDANGEAQAFACLVVGTDGHRSVVRTHLGIAWHPYHYDHAYLGLEADRPPSYENALSLHIHAAGGVLLMPHPGRVGIGCLVEAGSASHWLSLNDKQLAEALVGRAPILAGMTLYRQGAHVYALTRSHALRYCMDGAVIIGDAAHCTNPTAGQGMAMALTDAGALAELVGPALENGARHLDQSLMAFEARQWPLNQRLVRSSHIVARLYALRGPAWSRCKIALLRVLANPLTAKLVRPLIASFLN